MPLLCMPSIFTTAVETPTIAIIAPIETYPTFRTCVFCAVCQSTALPHVQYVCPDGQVARWAVLDDTRVVQPVQGAPPHATNVGVGALTEIVIRSTTTFPELGCARAVII